MSREIKFVGFAADREFWKVYDDVQNESVQCNRKINRREPRITWDVLMKGKNIHGLDWHWLEQERNSFIEKNLRWETIL